MDWAKSRALEFPPPPLFLVRISQNYLFHVAPKFEKKAIPFSSRLLELFKVNWTDGH